MSKLPLDGIVIVAMEQAVAVPFATRQLGDLGARVIKIERPGTGDFSRGYDDTVKGMSSAFAWLNRGKESVVLDIKNPEDRAVLDELLTRADVFIHNISPEAAVRARLDSTTLSAKYPHLISGSVSGYGEAGPLANAKAYDLLVQGETGIMSLSGDEGNFAKVGISIADISAGMYSYASILAAIYHRERTGIALTADVSLFDSLTEWLGYPLLYTKYGGTPPRRLGTSHATIAPYGGFHAADGPAVLLAVQNEREWVRFCTDVVKLPALLDDPRFGSHTLRVDNREELDELVATELRSVDRSVLLDRLRHASIAHSDLNSIEDLQHHPQLQQRDRWVNTDSEVGSIRTVRPPWSPLASGGDFGRIPSLGEHTREVYEWLGLQPRMDTK